MRKNYFVKLNGVILSLCMLSTGFVVAQNQAEFKAAFDVVDEAVFSDTAKLADGSKEAQEKQKEVAKTLPLELKLKEFGISFRLIPAGSFNMGSPKTEAEKETQHQVTLTKNFWMGKYEITQEQWQAVMGNNPSNFKGANQPVETVSWNECQEFIKKLNEKFKDKLPKGYVFDLPTEAQWEYACRAGTTTPFYFGNNIETTQVNFNNTIEKTVPVGSYTPNAWGLYDMHGNVWEWCRDSYGDYSSNAATDPLVTVGNRHVLRGGGWFFNSQLCRSALRDGSVPDSRGISLGFRLVLRQE